MSSLLDQLTAWATGRGGTSPGPEGLAVLDRVAQARGWPSSAPFYLTARQAVWRGDVAGAVRVLQAAGDPASAGENYLPGADKAAAALLSGLQAREADAERLADVRQDAADAALSPLRALFDTADDFRKRPGPPIALALVALLGAAYLARR